MTNSADPDQLASSRQGISGSAAQGLMYLQNVINISHVVEDLRRFPYFLYFVLLRRCLGQ